MRLLAGAALALAIAGVASRAAADEAPKSFEEYQRASSLACVGAPGFVLPAPDVKKDGPFTVTITGAIAQLRREGKSSHPGEARLGVLAGIKDLEEATRKGLEGFFAEFKKADVDAVLVGGDTAYGELELEEILSFLGEQGLPVLVIIGNNESRAAFNRAALASWRKHPLVLNLDLVRRVDGEGFDVVSLGGYHDKNFASTSGACLYKEEDLASLKELAAKADDPVVLLAHGPPLQSGKAALDFVPGAGNVGDPALTKAIAAAGIHFGVAGHILEAGGRGTDLPGKKPVAEGKSAKELFVNPGQANSLPYSLSLGFTSYGTATILSLKGGEGSFRLLRAARPATP